MKTEIEEFQFQDIPLPDIADLEDIDDLLDLGSDGASPHYSPSDSSSIGSPANSSYGDLLSQSDSSDPFFAAFSSTEDTTSTEGSSSPEAKSTKRKSKKCKTKKIVRSGENKNKRNERERRRVKKLSDAFENLRDSVPFLSGNRKLSKLDTLKNALSYISYLDNLLCRDRMQQIIPDQGQVIIPSIQLLNVIDCQSAGVQVWPYQVAFMQDTWTPSTT